MKQNKLSYKVGQFLMFAGPATILFAAVVIVPFFYGLYLTFTSWDGVAANKPFVGLQNYKDAFADIAYWDALGRTVVYSVISVVLVNIVAFVLAYLVTSGLKGQNFFRAGFFIPNLIGGIVLGYVWKFMFNRAFVAIGTAVVGHDTSSLLGTTNGALFALILVSVWQYAGYMMLIYVAGFMGVDDSLREAALIDGCSNGQAMRHVIIPLMRASFVQCIFLSTTRCFMVYDLNLSLTKGEPFNSSVMAAMHVYNKAFVYKNYGVGQAEALILFIICAVIGMIQVYVGKKGEVAA
ncbi:sugar ABC transporter permease [Alloscardovia omnicolens]|nr:sugar ABC transporter permease [Alloscardovia omnicolens]MBS6345752.1 sugar ABC transporter permease [Alloscardovia omnicolens]MDK6249874.1 sugar ABC transporter permease [Alloscardovia omnicolens]MDK6251177.1 sugar ABC transporter permease [Alloscardovia omnicolens]MDK6445519.1 sugar ABC transporter permease [Alloscardovia omnicolens]MDK6663487.1 sugar ABC transporter permease [Alloscardovia omnicolens]